MANPKAFISYSWSSPEHETRVLDLANHLVESGVEVVIDKWDLREGHDAHAFMEQMVTNPDIKKVLLICDETYQSRANARSGGVGAETQILTPELYGTQSQEKFVALVFEKNAEGRACVPAYYRSRIYIDFTDPTKEAESFDQLLRWLYDKPLHQRPKLGSAPSFLVESDRVRLGTATFQRRAVEAARSGKESAEATLSEYLNVLSRELETLRIEKKDGVEHDDAVVASIEEFLPHRDEFIETMQAFALYRDSSASWTSIHRFFESLIPYLHPPEDATSYSDEDFDNFQFIVHELLLYAVAVLLKHERFEGVNAVLQDYYVGNVRRRGSQDNMAAFDTLRTHLTSLERRKTRLNLNRASLRADLLHSRAKNVGISFQHVAQADFVLYVRANILLDAQWHRWFPESLLYVAGSSSPFELFARSVSRAFFDRFKVALGVSSKDQLVKFSEELRAGVRRAPRWQSAFSSVDPISLMALDAIATKP